MYTNVEEALSRIVGFGLLRPNRFNVKFAFPSWGNLSEYEHLVEGIEIPNISISTADYQLNGLPIIKIPYAKTPAGTCAVTFRESKGGDISASFTDWIKYMVFNNQGDSFVRYAEETWGEVIFTAYNTAEGGPFPVYKVTLIAAIPTSVESVNYSFDDRDSYVKQSVTFTYHDAKYETNPPHN